MDGTVDSTEPNPTFTYEENGVFDATLKVTDSTGRSAAASVPIIIGNMAPVVELTTSPAPGEPFQFGQQVTYQVTVTDDSRGLLNGYCRLHPGPRAGHPLSSTAGCTGTITTWSTLATPARATSAPCSWPPTPMSLRTRTSRR